MSAACAVQQQFLPCGQLMCSTTVLALRAADVFLGKDPYSNSHPSLSSPHPILCSFHFSSFLPHTFLLLLPAELLPQPLPKLSERCRFSVEILSVRDLVTSSIALTSSLQCLLKQNLSECVCRSEVDVKCLA